MHIFFWRNIRNHAFEFWSSESKHREKIALSLLLQARSVFEVEDCSGDVVGMRFKIRSHARLWMWG